MRISTTATACPRKAPSVSLTICSESKQAATSERAWGSPAYHPLVRTESREEVARVKRWPWRASERGGGGLWLVRRCWKESRTWVVSSRRPKVERESSKAMYRSNSAGSFSASFLSPRSLLSYLMF
jgi:hypothetical protein